MEILLLLMVEQGEQGEQETREELGTQEELGIILQRTFEYTQKVTSAPRLLSSPLCSLHFWKKLTGF